MPNFKEVKEKNVEGYTWKNEDKRQDVQPRKNYVRMFFTNIYIYIRVFLLIKV